VPSIAQFNFRELRSEVIELLPSLTWRARLLKVVRGCGVETVALESTGSYWITLYEILEERGFQVRVVNARHVKNVPGRTKTDVLDCQWIQKLHSFGLLSGSFRPDQQIRTLRSLMRLRDNLVVQSTQSVHHMQKALFEMNVQLSNVISDIVGESGMRIVEAILAGERDPAVLAALCSTRIKASHDKPSLRACTATGARSCFSPSRGTGVLPLRPKQNRRVRYGHYRAPRTI
jgi:transposase